MHIPVQPFLLSIPSIAFIIVHRIQKQDWASIFKYLGWKLSPINYLVIGLGMGLLPGILSIFLPNILPLDILDQPGIAQTVYSDWSLGISTFMLAFLREAVYVALGEEILFRGFLGGILFRRMGFVLGNIIQSILFLIPHLLLLTISVKLWPLLIAQFIGGWLYGWLFHKSDSILPSWLSHSLGNAFGAMVFMS
jgi:membrane protease YdiL (CAAX protease family)